METHVLVGIVFSHFGFAFVNFNRFVASCGAIEAVNRCSPIWRVAVNRSFGVSQDRHHRHHRSGGKDYGRQIPCGRQHNDRIEGQGRKRLVFRDGKFFGSWSARFIYRFGKPEDKAMKNLPAKFYQITR